MGTNTSSDIVVSAYVLHEFDLATKVNLASTYWAADEALAAVEEVCLRSRYPRAPSVARGNKRQQRI